MWVRPASVQSCGCPLLCAGSRRHRGGPQHAAGFANWCADTRVCLFVFGNVCACPFCARPQSADGVLRTANSTPHSRRPSTLSRAGSNLAPFGEEMDVIAFPSDEAPSRKLSTESNSSVVAAVLSSTAPSRSPSNASIDYGFAGAEPGAVAPGPEPPVRGEAREEEPGAPSSPQQDGYTRLIFTTRTNTARWLQFVRHHGAGSADAFTKERAEALLLGGAHLQDEGGAHPIGSYCFRPSSTRSVGNRAL